MKTWKIVLSEPIHPVGTEFLTRHAEWRIAPNAEDETLFLELKDADGFIVRAKGWVGGELMDVAPRLRVIGRHGVGVDNVDIPAATERGIWVVNTPEANSEAVAEHVFAVMLAFARKIVLSDQAMRRGDWKYRDRDYGFELVGTTLGIIGMGRIGRRVAAIGAKAFSQRILYADVVSNAEVERETGARRVPLIELLAESDIVTVHTPATPETNRMLRREQFAAMKPGAVFINASRGAVVEESALIEAIVSGRLGGAGLDVFETEPLPMDSPLLQFPNVLLSPHKAGQSEGSMRRMALVAEDILRVLRGETPKYPVNRPERPRTVVS